MLAGPTYTMWEGAFKRDMQKEVRACLGCSQMERFIGECPYHGARLASSA